MSVDVWRQHWRQRDWIQELSYLTLLTMEACIIHPWWMLFSAGIGSEGIPFWAFAALLWASYLCADLLNRSELRADRKQALIAGMIILSALGYIRLFVYTEYAIWQLGWIGDTANSLFAFDRFPPELLAIILVFIGWWRGIVAARKGYDTPTVWFHFRVGVILLFGYLLVAIFVPHPDATPLILGFFFSGLISIALARILELGGIHGSTLGSKRWIAVLVGSTLGSLGLGLLMTVLFSREVLRTVLGWLQPLWDVVGWLAWTLFSVVLYLLFPLLELVMDWVTQIIGQEGGQFEGLFGSPQFSPLFVMQEEEPPGIYPVCRTILVLVIVVGGLLFVARLIRKFTQEQNALKDVERESLFSGTDVINDLRKGLLGRLEQIAAMASQFGRHRRSVASIRKIYASMVDLATEAGYPRRTAQTPYEYCNTLYDVFPGGGEAVDGITEAYVRTHYGQVPDTPEKMQRIVQYWERLQEQVVPRPRKEEA